MFFPIDAYAQTIQINSIGFNKELQIFDGDGNLSLSIFFH